MTRVFKFRRPLELADGWVVENLRRRHNSLVPGGLVEELGQGTTERLLSEILNEEIELVQQSNDWTAWRR